jgi:hypothetical protein
LIKSVKWAEGVLEKIGIRGVKVVLVIKGVLGREKFGKYCFMGSNQMIGVSSVKLIALGHDTLNILLP